jgi:hypothetical protein
MQILIFVQSGSTIFIASTAKLLLGKTFENLMSGSIGLSDTATGCCTFFTFAPLPGHGP